MTTLPDLTSEERAAFPRWRRNIALFLTSQTVSLFGSSLVQYAVLWYLTLTTKNGGVLTLALIAGFLPQAIVSIFGGVLADRMNRKVLIIIADLSIAAATLILVFAMAAGHSDLWMILLALAVRSAGAGVQTPAVTAVLPQLVPQSRLLRVNGINQSIQSAMMLISPVVAAVLYAALPLSRILMIDVVTAVAGVLLFALVPVATLAGVRDKDSGYLADLKEGIGYVRGHAFVRWLIVFFAVSATLVAAPSYLTPLMVARDFGEEEWKLMALEIAFAVGMLIGGALLAAFGSRFRRIRLMMWSMVAVSLFAVGLGLSPNLVIFLAFMALAGLSVPGFSTVALTTMQEIVEPEKQGRVFALVTIVNALAMPCGLAVFGPLADVIAVNMVLVLTGVLMLVALGLMVLPARARRTLVDAEALLEQPTTPSDTTA